MMQQLHQIESGKKEETSKCIKSKISNDIIRYVDAVYIWHGFIWSFQQWWRSIIWLPSTTNTKNKRKEEEEQLRLELLQHVGLLHKVKITQAIYKGKKTKSKSIVLTQTQNIDQAGGVSAVSSGASDHLLQDAWLLLTLNVVVYDSGCQSRCWAWDQSDASLMAVQREEWKQTTLNEIWWWSSEKNIRAVCL